MLKKVLKEGEEILTNPKLQASIVDITIPKKSAPFTLLIIRIPIIKIVNMAINT